MREDPCLLLFCEDDSSVRLQETVKVCFPVTSLIERRCTNERLVLRVCFELGPLPA